MNIAPEIHAAIIKVAGDWALGIASSPDRGETPKLSQMSGELETHFDFSYKFLMEYLGYSSD